MHQPQFTHSQLIANGLSPADIRLQLKSGSSQEFLDWLADSVTFPNAMVDRIVPAPTDDTRAVAARVLGVEDACAVPAELFTMWVIEDEFAAGRPRWEAAGAIFSDEVEKYELVKLRLLNGCHSLIAYLGGLTASTSSRASRTRSTARPDVAVDGLWLSLPPFGQLLQL